MKNDYKILQIIPADGWVLRVRLDEMWGGEELDSLGSKKRQKLQDTHIIFEEPIACFALVEWNHGTQSVEPMTDGGGDGLLITGDLPNYQDGIFYVGKGRRSKLKRTFTRCRCQKCQSQPLPPTGPR